MTPLWVYYALAAGGILVAIFAQQVGDVNAGIVARLPGVAKRTYDVASLGRPLNSVPWVVYNRVGGVVVALGAAIGIFLRSR